MIRLLGLRIPPNNRKQIRTQFRHGHILIHLPLRENVLLAKIHHRNRFGRPHLHIRIEDTIIADTFEAMDVSAFRHMQTDDLPPRTINHFRQDTEWRVKQIRIIHDFDEILDNGFTGVFRNAYNLPVICNAQEQIAAIAIQKRAEAVKNVPRRITAALFEFNARALTRHQIRFQLFRCHVNPPESGCFGIIQNLI